MNNFSVVKALSDSLLCGSTDDPICNRDLFFTQYWTRIFFSTPGQTILRIAAHPRLNLRGQCKHYDVQKAGILC